MEKYLRHCCRGRDAAGGAFHACCAPVTAEGGCATTSVAAKGGCATGLAAVIVAAIAVLAGPSRAAGAEGEWRVGLAAVKVTPEAPIPMNGYGPEVSGHVSDGALDELYAKAMAVEYPGGDRAVLLTADLLFFRAETAETLAKRVMEKTALERRQILLNASHTHAGPVFGLEEPTRYRLSEDQRKTIDAYTQKLLGQLADLVDAALADMKPARLSWATGTAPGFVVNRRLMSAEGKCRGMGPNPQGLVDRDVPVLRVDWPDGRLRAVVFGCACHPVTLDGSNRKLSGDYAGRAQQYVEERLPGVRAMFVAGCGADANATPRGGPEQHEWVRKHGQAMGEEICRVLEGKFRPVGGPLRAELQWTELPLETTLSRDRLKEIAASGPTFWHKRNAQGMIEVIDRGEPLPKSYRAAIALWQFGGDLTLVALPGEVVAGYVPMLRQALGPDRLWVAGYSNDSFGYLPTAKILAEGGHETIGLTFDTGFFSPQAQDVVVAAARELARKAGRTSP